MGRAVHFTLPFGESCWKVAAWLDGHLKSQLGAAWKKQRHNVCSTFLIIGAQSVKSSKTALLKKYGAGKKILDIKHHIAVNILRLPDAVSVTTAKITDRKGRYKSRDKIHWQMEATLANLSPKEYEKLCVGKLPSEVIYFMPKSLIIERSFA